MVSSRQPLLVLSELILIIPSMDVGKVMAVAKATAVVDGVMVATAKMVGKVKSGCQHR